MAAKRSSTKKFKTPEAQGDDSYIVFSIPGWGETKEFIRQFRDQGRAYLEEDALVDEIEDTLLNDLWAAAQDKFVSWNWVDGEGHPLPGLNELTPNDLLNTEMQSVVQSIRELYRIVNVEQEKKVPRR